MADNPLTFQHSFGVNKHPVKKVIPKQQNANADADAKDDLTVPNVEIVVLFKSFHEIYKDSNEQ